MTTQNSANSGWYDEDGNRKPINLENRRKNLTTGLGMGVMCHDMVKGQKARNNRNRRSDHTPDPEIKRWHLTKGLGTGMMCHHMVSSQKKRNAKGRQHGDLTIEQAREIFITKFIQQSGKCAVTGLPLVVNGTGTGNPWDALRASCDRLDNSTGYTLDNCRIVCSFVNTALSFACPESCPVIEAGLALTGPGILAALGDTKPACDFAPILLDPDLLDQVKDWSEFQMKHPPNRMRAEYRRIIRAAHGLA